MQGRSRAETLRRLKQSLFRRRPGPVPLAAPEVVAAEFSREEQGPAAGSRVRTFGTFGGVFTPSFLTIIGVIMYLRFSWVLANAGLFGTLAIVVIANAITFITALSVAGIASNEQMETGGAYFMVSRVLGYQTGGGVGIPLFISQALSIALYAMGFAEALTAVVPLWSIQTVAVVTMLVLAVAGLAGARFMVLLQYLILVLILVSFVSIAAGFRPLYLPQNLAPGFLPGLSFWAVFAVFFPAVTGILAGVSMSGDLKDPARSIPRGTFFAVGAGFLVYLLVPVMLAFTVARGDLWVSTALRDASRWPALVTVGVVGATLSSAIGSLMGAPRTLQALGVDGVVPRILGRGVGRTAEPLPAMGISMGLALAAILLGSLNQIAEVLTMFFLTTYGVLNLSAGLERLVGNPSFRPSVRVPWWVSFTGAVCCIGVMFLISVAATVTAIAAVLIIFLWLHVRQTRSALAAGDSPAHGGLWEGFWTTVFLRVSRRIVRSRTGSGKNWRPFVQVFAADANAHSELMTTAALLTRRTGALAIYTMLPHEQARGFPEIRRQAAGELEGFTGGLAQPNLDTRVIETAVFHEGVVVAAQAAAFGAAAYNTVMLGLPDTSAGDRDYTRMLIRLCEIDRNVLMLKKGVRPWTMIHGPILVWWGGRENNVRLMLILAHLLRNSVGTLPRIMLKTIVPDESQREEASERLTESLMGLRVDAETEIVVNSLGEPLPSVLARESARASLVLLGMARPDELALKSYLPRLRQTAEGLDTTLFVMSNIPGLRYV